MMKKKLTDDEMSLAELNPGDVGVICHLNDHTSACDRLLEMGLNNGTSFRVIKFAPLGDPIEIKIRGYHLSIRKSAAHQIRVRRRHRGGHHENR
jgi:Fe2+ transport system protein FeoA